MSQRWRTKARYDYSRLEQDLLGDSVLTWMGVSQLRARA
jgi:hypothetical protein